MTDIDEDIKKKADLQALKESELIELVDALISAFLLAVSIILCILFYFHD